MPAMPFYRFDGHDVGEMRDLPRLVGETEVGKATSLEVWRKGQHVTLKIKLGELKEETEAAAPADTGDEQGKSAAPSGERPLSTLGLSVAPLTQQLRENALALCLIITIFSFIGLPPLAGFFGKQMVLTSALNNNHTILVIVAILTSVIGAVYYLSIIKTIYFNTKEYIKSYKIVQMSLSNYLSISLAILTLIISVFILIPNEPINLSNLLANSLADTASMDFEEKELYKFFSDT